MSHCIETTKFQRPKVLNLPLLRNISQLTELTVLEYARSACLCSEKSPNQLASG